MLYSDKGKSCLINALTSVVASGSSEVGLLSVVGQESKGNVKDGSMGLKVYDNSGFGTSVEVPSGAVKMLTVVLETTSGGGTLLVAQSQ